MVSDSNRSQNSSGLTLSTNAVADDFEEKIHELELEEREKETVTKANRLNIPYINLVQFPIAPEAIAIIPEAKARELNLACFYRDDDDLRLAVVDPDSQAVNDYIKELYEQGYKKIELYLVSPHSFERSLQSYRSVPKIKEVRLGVNITEQDLQRFKASFTGFDDLAKKMRKISMTDLITFIIASAIEARASDIHIEAEEKDIKVRFRIDGLLHDIVSLPPESWKKVINRIKLLARLKLNVTDRPQDGGFTIKLAKEKIDVRISAIPTNYGESVVMRLLMSSATSIKFEDLGLRGKAFLDLEREMAKPNGMLITTGPTGSGKTTTLYAILNKLNSSETKIITLEDPIEYKLEGINQSQIRSDEDYTFAKGLRSILRQDPDVVMVGEIRDLETAETAINAALTGHLVISTLHTNSASGTIPRFLGMRVKPFLLAPAINAMIGQRLVRRICDQCKEKIELDNQTMSKVMEVLSKVKAESGEKVITKDSKEWQFYKGKGCQACQGLGYRGRVGIYEIMTMNQEIEKLILSGEASEYQMQDIAIKNGMITMAQDGLLKALDGITTVDEVLRVAEF
ncbi:MAG: GspE/PulE family protein [Patescibacteria group bacterium]